MRLQPMISVLVAGALLGCARDRPVLAPPEPGPDYARPLPVGQSALRPVSGARLPDLAAAYRVADARLLEAIDHSLSWYAAPSSRQFFPIEGVTHRRAEASVFAMRELLSRRSGEQAFVAEVVRRFDIYESVGYDGSGTVLFTGYYAPVFSARRTPSGHFVHPLYRRPGDLATDPKTGEPQGRRLPNGRIVPYFSRRKIEESRLLAGRELVWLEDPLSVYLVHVNGSAKLRLTDPGGAGVMYVGYAGKTDRPYTGLGRSMIEAGLLEAGEVSLPAIKRVYRQDPQRVIDLIYRNESYVFFQEYDGGNWPAGSLGVPVVAERSLATDKKIFPRGSVVLVDTKAVTLSRGKRDFCQFMLDQDTGGAIQAPGRADIFMGVGPSAEIMAGGQYAEGKMYYFFLKPEYVPE